MKTICRFLTTVVLVPGLLSLGAPVFGAGADDQTELIKSLLNRIEQLEKKVEALESGRSNPAVAVAPADIVAIQELDQKIRILERKKELESEDSAARAKTAARVTMDAGGFSASSADTNFVLKLRGGLQADGRFFPGDETPAKDTFLLRRVRPIAEGTAFGKFDYRLMLDFATGVSSSTFNNANLLDAYVNYRILPEFQIQAGKFKEPVGLERLQSWQNLLFVERGLPTLLVPNRDTGVQLQGDIGSGLLQYAFGVFNGTEDGGSSDFDADSDKDLAARLFTHPFRNSRSDTLRGLGLGVSGTWGQHQGALRNYSTLGQQPVFSYITGPGTNAARPNVTADGTLWRVSPQAYYYRGPFGVFGEYVLASHEIRRDAGGPPQRLTAEHTAWQVAASWFLTGEQNSFRPVAPLKNFNPGNGGWGSLELAARVGELDLDDELFPLYANPATSASGIFSWGVGLNWRLNRNVKLTLNYEHADLDAAKGAKLPFDEEDVIFTRAQIAF